MNKSPENFASDVNKEAPLKLDDETLRTLTGDYFAESFPNPDRTDCPAPAQLRAQAQAQVQLGRLPDETLRAHLFGCSACFTAYREARALRPVAAPQPNWRDKLATIFLWRPGLAWAGAVALLIGIVWLTQSQRRNEPSSAPVLVATTSPTPTATPAPTLSATPPQPSSPTARRQTVDLNDYLALRDVTAANTERTIQLSPSLTELRLRLPEGSLPGVYTVSLVNDADQLVSPSLPLRSRKDILMVTLNMRRLAAQRLRLRIQAAGEAPDFYPVQIQPR